MHCWPYRQVADRSRRHMLDASIGGGRASSDDAESQTEIAGPSSPHASMGGGAYCCLCLQLATRCNCLLEQFGPIGHRAESRNNVFHIRSEVDRLAPTARRWARRCAGPRRALRCAHGVSQLEISWPDPPCGCRQAAATFPPKARCCQRAPPPHPHAVCTRCLQVP